MYGQQQQQNGNNRFAMLNQSNAASDPLYDDVQGFLKDRTHLIQIYTSNPEEAPRLISQTHPSGIPLMVIISDQPCCCYHKVNIPSGVFTLETSCGVNQGIMNPGYYCCYMSYKMIKVMITKNTIRFKCPITNVPTKDNVRVAIDVGINFHIGRSKETEEEDLTKFFYNFGPNRLEELLMQAMHAG